MTSRDWERMADDAVADALYWKQRARNAENALLALIPVVQAASDASDGAYGRDIDAALAALEKGARK